MIRRILVAYFLLALSVNYCDAVCGFSPFPPYPPSPPEFQNPIELSSTSEGILVGWEVVPDQEGYLVSICNDSRGYRPVNDGVTVEQLLIENPGSAGEYRILVKAFVKVEESYVFNGGQVASISWSGNKAELTDAKDVTLEAVVGSREAVKVPDNVVRVAGEVPESIVAAFPAFTPSQSFYNAEYPTVSNPFVPQPTPDGRMAPALLTDDGITQTVARVSKKWEGRRKSPKKSEMALAEASSFGLHKNLASAETKAPSQERYDKPGAGSGQDVKKLVIPEKPIGKMSGGVVEESPESEPSEDPESKNSDLLVYLIVGFIVLAFIYFIFQKEEK